MDAPRPTPLLAAVVLAALFAVLPSTAHAASGDPTTTTVQCVPPSVGLGIATLCRAVVEDAGADPVSPAGTVTFADGAAPGTFAPSATCTLVPVSTSQSRCTVQYTPAGLPGATPIGATYNPGSHLTSANAFGLDVVPDGTTFTVNANDDTNDTVCNVSHCSLREAIVAANANANPTLLDRIAFSGAVGSIAFTNAGAGEHSSSERVVIDGTTHPSYGVGSPAVEIDGSAVSFGIVPALSIGGPDVTVKALAINNFSGEGVFIGGAGDFAAVEGSFIGTNAGGFLREPNRHGISAGADDVRVGGFTVGQRNVLSGNAFFGLRVRGDRARVHGNYVGMSSDGNDAVSNGTVTQGGGIELDNSPSDAEIGGPTAEAGNTVSGNPLYGMSILSGNGGRVEGNRIGVRPVGTGARPNGNGVRASTDVTIGGPSPGQGNTISGNAVDGVLFTVGASPFNVSAIQGNRIGTRFEGDDPLPNGGYGVRMTGADDTLLGGSGAGEGNIIAGNGQGGVLVDPVGGAKAIRGNRIGVDVNGDPLGNGGPGITSFASTLTVGGVATEANQIRNNTGAGVAVPEGATRVTQNSIVDNGGLGIDVGADGVTANDPGDADGAANFPVRLAASTDGSGRRVVARLVDAAPSTTYRLQLFRSDACDGSGNGEGQEWLETTDVGTDASGFMEYDVTGPALPVGSVLTATATRGDTTSELSPCAPITDPVDLTSTVEAPAGATAGEELPFTVTAGNPGPDTAKGVELELSYPPDATFVSAPAGCTDSAGTVTCDVGDVAPAGSAARVITLRRDSPGDVAVTSTVRGDQLEADPTNDAGAATATVAAAPAAPAAGPAPAAEPAAPGPEPELASTVTVQEVSGVVTVTLPGGRVVGLGTLTSVPVGATIDATKGRVRLFAENADGEQQSAEFYEGAFVVTQDRTGLVDLRIVGAVGPCPELRTEDPLDGTRARTAQRGGAKRKLWGDGKGRFRVSGKHSAAVVRGTRWLVEDACDGTTTRVEVGIVRVVDHALGRTTDVPAGRTHRALPLALPEKGRTVNIVAERRSGATSRLGEDVTPLQGFRQVAVGPTVYDASRTAVRVVTSAAPQAGTPTQWATFTEGAFRVRQPQNGIASLALSGPAPTCATARRARGAQRRRTRKLWGDGEGRFRVAGKHTAAVVRGTRWYVEDRCDASVVGVLRGTVWVEDFARRALTSLTAPGRVVVRPPRRR